MAPVLILLASLVYMLFAHAEAGEYGLALICLAPLVVWILIFVNFGVKYSGYKKKIGR